MTKPKENNKKYDEIPYRSFSFGYCSPEHLRTMGTLFGMEPVPLKTARVLELGCSEGYNLFRFAETYPQSFTLGVDLSEVKIARGQKAIESVKLKNIELKSMSITDIDESYGKFDYIICNCVFSWVPEFVRNAILEISKKLLSKNGIVFINYNTLPGFNMMRSIRELMMFHTSGFTDITAKIQQARLILNFLDESLEEQKTPYAELVRKQSEMIPNKEDYVLCWEYLSEINQPYYLHEFVDKAQSCGFSYLGDTNLRNMYANRLPKKAIELLATITDAVRLEQYLDFIQNTAVRSTLLCHQGTNHSRRISNDTLSEFYYCSNLILKDPENTINLDDESTANFYLSTQEVPISTTNPATKAILMALFKNSGNPLSLDDLTSYANKLSPKLNNLQIKESIYNNLTNLMAQGCVQFVLDKPNSVSAISKKPKISNLAQVQIQQAWPNNLTVITNALNITVPINSSKIEILKCLDGKHTVDQIKKKTLDNFKQGKMVATDNDTKTKIEDEERLKVLANNLVDSALEELRRNFCLVS